MLAFDKNDKDAGNLNDIKDLLDDKKGEDIVDGIEELFQGTSEDGFKLYWEKNLQGIIIKKRIFAIMMKRSFLKHIIFYKSSNGMSHHSQMDM